MKILICGDRNWCEGEKIRNRIKKLNPIEDIIITGGARGADFIANKIAEDLNFNTIIKRADWEKFGRSAGPIRNRQMLDLNPELVIAFHSNIEQSRGTKDCVNEAKRRGIKVEVIE